MAQKYGTQRKIPWRGIIIAAVFIVIIYYLIPLFMQVSGSLNEEKLENSLLPWQFVFKSSDDEVAGEAGMRLWTKKLLKLGLDLQGGMEIELKVDTSKLPADEKERAVKAVIRKIRNRIDQFGVAEPSIQRQGQDRIMVQSPGLKDFDRAKKLIGQTALLEFRLVAENTDLKKAVDNLDKYFELNIEKYPELL
ncbi:MAG: hypothetical protein K8S56_00920, partial [Candidatus Cloacimonetes bacterium]|nr:hypothetical protein [Candidatus Cloacimonadota bacterium]